MRKKTLLCLTLLALGGCADVANMAGYDSQTLNQKAAQGYQQILGEAQSQNALDNRSPTAQRVHNIFNRMVPAANANNRTGVPFNWEMHVIRSDELNAWAMPGGKMAVYSGLVEKLNLTDDELAAVIGHEMTHALREHSKAQVGQQLLTGIGMQLGGSLLAKNSNIDPQTLQTGGALLSEYGISKPFSRQHETEADIGGLMLMASAGYNPQAALSVWQKMAQAAPTASRYCNNTCRKRWPFTRAAAAQMPHPCPHRRQLPRRRKATGYRKTPASACPPHSGCDSRTNVKRL